MQRGLQRLTVVAVVLALAACFLPVSTRADTGYTFVGENIAFGETLQYSFTIQENDGLYGRFRINYGQQIYFFIVDQNGHEAVKSGLQASTVYLAKCYERSDGEWYEWTFVAPHASTWYVYYSKVFGAPVTAEEVCIEGYVRQDTDPPALWANVPDGNLTGLVDIQVEAVDEGFPIDGISLWVDGVLHRSYTMSESSKHIGRTVTLDTTQLEEGEHELRLDVWDQLSHVNSLYRVVHVVHAGFPWELLILGTVCFAVVALVICLRRD